MAFSLELVAQITQMTRGLLSGPFWLLVNSLGGPGERGTKHRHHVAPSATHCLLLCTAESTAAQAGGHGKGTAGEPRSADPRPGRCPTGPRCEGSHLLGTRKIIKVPNKGPEGNSVAQAQIHAALYTAVWLKNRKQVCFHTKGG